MSGAFVAGMKVHSLEKGGIEYGPRDTGGTGHWCLVREGAVQGQLHVLHPDLCIAMPLWPVPHTSLYLGPTSVNATPTLCPRLGTTTTPSP